MKFSLFFSIDLLSFVSVQSPQERPSANELLESDLIPVPTPVNESIKEALRPRAYFHLLSELFSRSSLAAKITDNYSNDPLYFTRLATKGKTPVSSQ